MRHVQAIAFCVLICETKVRLTLAVVGEFFSFCDVSSFMRPFVPRCVAAGGARKRSPGVALTSRMVCWRKACDCSMFAVVGRILAMMNCSGVVRCSVPFWSGMALSISTPLLFHAIVASNQSGDPWSWCSGGWRNVVSGVFVANIVCTPLHVWMCVSSICSRSCI